MEKKERRKKFRFDNKNLDLVVGVYSNGRMGVYLDYKGEGYADVTVNMNYSLEGYNYAFIKPDLFECGCKLYDALLKEGIMKESREVAYGNFDQRTKCVAFDLNKLREYDPAGVEEVEKNIEKIEKEDRGFEVLGYNPYWSL